MNDGDQPHAVHAPLHVDVVLNDAISERLSSHFIAGFEFAAARTSNPASSTIPTALMRNTGSFSTTKTTIFVYRSYGLANARAASSTVRSRSGLLH